MIDHKVHASPSKDELPREDQLAWKMAELAVDPVAVDEDVIDMIINRIIDNASWALLRLIVAPLNPPERWPWLIPKRAVPLCSARLKGKLSVRNGQHGQMGQLFGN